MPPVNRRPRRVAVRAHAAIDPPVSLRMLADHLGLSPATISLVVNRAPGARAIPKATPDRVLSAARRFHYRPNSIARSLRVGFDDIQSAAFQQPGLTTVRQPLRRMGELAAEIVVRRIDEPGKTIHAKQVRVEPRLIVRGSTGAAGPLADCGR